MNASENKLHGEYNGDEVNLKRFFSVLWHGRVAILIGILGAGFIGFGAASVMAPVYSAQSVFIPPQQQQSSVAPLLQSLGAFGGMMGVSAALRTPADQYAALLQTVTIQNKLVNRFGLLVAYEAKFKVDARKMLAKNTRISVGKKDGLVTVEVDDVDPKRAADLANSYVSELTTLINGLALTEAQQRRQFYERQLEVSKNKLIAAQTALQNSNLDLGMVRMAPQAAVEEYSALRAKIAAAEVKLQALSMTLTSESAEYKRTLSELRALKSSMTHLEAGKSTPASGNYIGAYREFKYQETLFDLLAKQLEAARLDESKEAGLLQVVDIAVAPERPSKPRKAFLAAACAFVGLLAGVVFTLIRDTMHSGRKQLS